MKNFIASLLILLSVAVSAQMIVKKTDGTVFTNNQVFNITSLVAPANYLGFYVQNTSNADIRVKIKCESITNATGADFELCFGLCIQSVSAGQRYPSANNAVTVLANSQTGAGDHLSNNNVGSGTFPMDYVFKFYMVDAAGAEIVGSSLTITYRYNPSAASVNFNVVESLGIDVTRNVSSDFVLIHAKKQTNVDLIDSTGKILESKTINVGENKYDVSGKAVGIYFLNFISEDGKSGVCKIIKK